MTQKSVTVSELKTFIEAVEFAADVEEWIPSERQWKRIRSMIDGLVDGGKQVTTEVHPTPMYQPPSLPPTFAPSGLAGMGPPPQLAAPFTLGQPSQPVRTPDIDTSNGSYSSAFAR